MTCGDIAGIGPEVALKAASRSKHECVLIGPKRVFGRTSLPVWDVPAAAVKRGAPSAEGGRVALAAIDLGVAACLAGKLDAIVTAPVSKTSMHAAGAHYPGQTEYLAHLCRVPEVRMMLAGPSLRVILCSTHLSLRDAISALTIDGVVSTARIAYDALAMLLGRKPKLGLCALNPHAGEGGLFGDEETRILLPAVKKLKAGNRVVHGPYPADTLFWNARRGDFDGVIVLFHDQGLIPLKLLHFDEGVNVTLGLPIIRTSPDHGTAYDIAGKGKADITSMTAAINFAASAATRARGARGSIGRKRRMPRKG